MLKKHLSLPTIVSPEAPLVAEAPEAPEEEGERFDSSNELTSAILSESTFTLLTGGYGGGRVDPSKQRNLRALDTYSCKVEMEILS
jgi:hypothetical protein